MECFLNNDNLGLAMCERSLTIQKAINAPNVLDQIQIYGEGNVLKSIVTLLILTSSYFNTSGNLTPEQATQIASLFLSEYKQESIEDLTLMLKKLKLGSYGKIYRIDGDTIFKCFNEYLSEKYAEFEKIKQNERVALQQQTTNDYIEFAAQVLEAKKIKPVEKAVPEYLTEKGHLETFKQLLPDCSDKDLADFLQYYSSKNAPVHHLIEYGQPITVGYFDKYIDEIKNEIMNRDADKINTQL
jgi:hypothetical protein